MKQILKRLLPHRVMDWMKRVKIWPSTIKEFKWWKKKAIHYSGYLQNNETSQLASLMVISHVLEKGITMPDRRIGFGIARARDVINLCKRCLNRYGAERVEIQAAIADLKQYRDIHISSKYNLPDDIEKGIVDMLPYLKEQDDNCYEIDKDAFFDYGADFKDFSISRHSIRWFADTVIDMNKLKKAIILAQTAPSACNRQATRVKIISSEKGKRLCSELQNGNRGFGERAGIWLLVTTEMGAWESTHVDIALVDAGIFTMNLLYSLHYYGFVACPLNAHIKLKDRNRLLEGLGVSTTELPATFVLVGNPCERFMVPKSRRLELNDIIQEI